MKITKEFIKQLIKEEISKIQISKIQEGDGQEKIVDIPMSRLKLIVTDGVPTGLLKPNGETLDLTPEQVELYQRYAIGASISDEEPVSAYKE